jgi:tetratricopeptide (TPR) repeat protein
MGRRIVAGAALGLGVFLWGCGTTGEDGIDYVAREEIRESARETAHEAVALFEQGKVEDGLERALDALDDDPSCLAAAVVASECLDSLNRKEEAVDLLMRLSRGRSPEFEAECMNQAAVLLNRRNQPSLAARCLERAVEVQPLRGDLWMSLGEAQAAAGWEQAALATYERALDVGDPVEQVVPIMAELALRMDRPAEAEELLETRLARAQMGPDELLLLGVAKCGLEQEEEGLALFDEVLGMPGSDLAKALFNRGRALEALKRMEEAADAYGRALVEKPVYPAAAYQLGRLLVDQGSDSEGMIMIDQAIEWEKNPIFKREMKDAREALADEAGSSSLPEG